MRVDHDPDQPLLREGAVGARARRVPYRERAHCSSFTGSRCGGPGAGDRARLVCGDRVLADSAEIVDLATARAPATALPAGSGRRRPRCASWSGTSTPAWGHTGAGTYHGLHGRRDLALAYGCTGVPPGSVGCSRSPIRSYPRHRPLSRDHAGDRGPVGGRGARHLRRGRDAPRRRPPVSLGRPLHGCRPTFAALAASV